MEILNISRQMIKNLSDKELTNFCTFLKSETEMDSTEFLINELARRLENTVDLQQDYDDGVDEHEELKAELKDLNEKLDAC